MMVEHRNKIVCLGKYVTGKGHIPERNVSWAGVLVKIIFCLFRNS
jgi:hypothetical protein